MTCCRTIVLVLFVALGVCGGCRYDSTGREGAAKAKKFKSDLVTAIAAAPRIEIVEHSWRDDFQDDEGGRVLDPKPVECKRITLTPEQRQDLYDRFVKMGDAPKSFTDSGMAAFVIEARRGAAWGASRRDSMPVWVSVSRR